MTAASICGTVHGVGLGPGDAELMTVRADRLIRDARVVAYFRKAGRAGRARKIVDGMLRPDAVELAMEYPVTTEIPVDDPRYNAALSDFYREWAARLAEIARGGRDVLVLCEGDPFFYGSFMHLHTRLEGSVPLSVVPAVTGMSGAWTAAGVPVAWGDDVLSVLPATLDEGELARRAADADALAVMKIGRNIDKVRRALAAAGKLERAWLVEFATMEGQRVRMLTEAGDRTTPYFSIVLVHGQGRRP